MYLAAFMQDMLRAQDDESSPCSSLIVQHSSISALPYRPYPRFSNTSTPSTCNVSGRARKDAGQAQTVFYLDQPFLSVSWLFTVDGYVDWVVNQAFNASPILESATVTDIKLISGSNFPLPCAPLEGEPPSFSQLLCAYFLLRLFIHCLGNGSYPSSSSNPWGTKRAISFGNDQGGGNKKQRQDDNNNNNNNNNPGDNGDNGRSHDNNDGKTPKGKGVAKGKEQDSGPPFCCIFHKLDPVKYLTCGHLRLTSFAYFLQHLTRQHLLNKYLHCKNCRTDWNPKEKDSERLWTEHKRAGNCRKATVEETGKLLPEEYEDIKEKSKLAGTDPERWFETWKMFFDHEAPDSPYLKNVAEETEASNFRRLNRVLEETLSSVPSGGRDQMEAFGRILIDRAFPAHVRQGSANAGPSTSRARQAPANAGPSTARGPEHAPQTPGRPGTGRAPATPRPVAPNTSNQGYPRPAGPSTPQNTGNRPRATGRTAAGQAIVAPGHIAPVAGIPAPHLRLGPNTSHPWPAPNTYPRPAPNTLYPRPTGPPQNTIDPRYLAIPGPVNPAYPANIPPNPPPLTNRHPFENNSATITFEHEALDHEAFESAVGRGYNAFFSQDDPNEPSGTDADADTDPYPRGQWHRI